MEYLYWVERLVQLRRSHMQQQLAATQLEIQYRRDLTQQYYREKPFFTSPLKRAMLAQRQLDRIVELSQERQRRQELLQQRQSKELDELLWLKMGAVNSLRASAPPYDSKDQLDEGHSPTQ